MTELEFLTIFGNSRRVKKYLKSFNDDDIGPSLVALCGLGIIKCANGNESFAEFMDGVQEGSGWTKDVCTGAWDKPKEFTNNIVPFPKGVD
jgi:hypothetical protein